MNINESRDLISARRKILHEVYMERWAESSISFERFMYDDKKLQNLRDDFRKIHARTPKSER